MAEVQQRESRSRTVVGKEMLQRMLQLEKQSQQRRSPPASTAPPVVDSAPSRRNPPQQEEHITRTQSYPEQETPKVPSRPTTAPRSKTQPLPPLAIPIRKPMKEIHASMGPEQGAESSNLPNGEICVSPSWSDFGNSKQKKEKKRLEREKKEQEKKEKKMEKEQRAAAKAAGKRLSKRPPPAAMETQRMPAALRPSMTSPPANSAVASKENSRTSSRRSSFNDHDPNSENTDRPSSSRHSFKSFFNAPKIFGPRSRSGSTGSQNAFGQGEREYLKDLVNRADEQDASDTEAKPQPPKRKARKVSFSVETDEAAPAISLDSKLELPWMASEGRGSKNSSASSLGLRNKRDGEYRHPSSTRPRSNEGMQQDPETMGAPGETRKARNSIPGPEQQDSPREKRGIQSTVKSSQAVHTGDGSGYVQKHRMHLQQRSIAGYEDELALGRFNDLTATQKIMELERQRLPPTPSDSFESLHRPKRIQEQYACSQEDLQGPTLQELKAEEHRLEHHLEHHPFYSERPLHPASFDRKPTSSPKGEKTSGYLRPKITSPSMSTTSSNTITKVSNATSSSFRPVSPPSPVSPETMAMVSNRSKAEDVFQTGENSPPSPPRRSSRRSSNKSGHETFQQPSFEASTASSKIGETPKFCKMPCPDPTSNGVQPFSQFSTTPDLSQPMDDSLSSYSWRSLDNVDRPSSSRYSTSASTISSVDSVPTPQLCNSKPVPEVVIEGIDGDGVTRRASIKRPRSQPQLQDPATTTQDLSFLPELKHQALVKPDRKSPTASLASSRSSFGANPPSSSDKHSLHSSHQFPTPSPPSTRPSSDDGSSLPVGASSLNYQPKTAFRSSNPIRPAPGSGSLLRPGSAPRRSTMSATPVVGGAGSGSAAGATPIKPLAKMFVICCKCKFWHDLPSALYKEMAMPRQIVGAEQDAGPEGVGPRNEASNQGTESERRRSAGKVHGRIETSVQCPWCEHGMSTACCAGWSCVVYLHERHH